MGMSDKSQKTTSSNQQQSTSSQTSSDTGTATTSTNVPQWLLTPTQQFASNIGNLQQQNPQNFVAGTNALQTQAQTAASNLTNPQYGVAKSTLTNLPQVQAESVLSGLSNYYNPFESAVMDPTMNQYDVNAQATQAAQAAAAAKNNAFGGSRYGIQEAQTAQDLAAGRAQTQGGLLNQMYTQAAGMSEADAARRQAAATTNQSADLQKAQELAAIRSQQADEARSNATLQEQVGQQQYANAMTSAQAPLTVAAQEEGLLSGLDPSALYGKTVGTTDTSTAAGQSAGTSSGTQNQTSSGGLLSNLGSLASVAGAIMAL